jgi:hypothetical protein
MCRAHEKNQKGLSSRMSQPRPQTWMTLHRLLLLVLLLCLALAVLLFQAWRRGDRPAIQGQQIARTPISLPSSQPATIPAATSRARPISSYLDVIRDEYPSLGTTQPLAFPLELNQAARLVLHDPVYLSKLRADLWIQRADAPPTAQVLKFAADPGPDDDVQTHVCREDVVYVHWSQGEGGKPIPQLVCEKKDQTYEVIWPGGRARLVGGWQDDDWDHAFDWEDDQVVVTSRSGVSIWRLGQPLPVLQYNFAAPTSQPDSQPTAERANFTRAQVLPDGMGLLAWIPWEGGRTGSHGAVRLVDGKVAPLGPAQGWPEKIVQLAPLRDGTVFQFALDASGAIVVSTSALEGGKLDEQAVADLVAQLNDDDADIRRKAVSDLANFGPSAWPVLSRLAPRQPPQARLLLRQLLKDKDRPTLSGMTLLGDRQLQLATRLSDGGVVFYAPQGVAVPEAADEPTVVAPAWLSVRPGHFVELLPASLVADLKPDACQLDVVGDQWVATTDARGPRLFFGNGFTTLLRKDELAFNHLAGMDARGRWLFRKDKKPGHIETLVIDPHLPDPTPRLPIWNLAIANTAGWDKNDWPVVKGEKAFALMETDWRELDKAEPFFTKLPLAAASATKPATSPTTEETSDNAILVAHDGTRYFGGCSSLKVITPQGKRIDWPLPPIANGTGPVCLVEAGQGKLFLFNQPGRVLRISRNPDNHTEPFKIEATFTKHLPTIRHPVRIWLDPAGRIDIVWDHRLTILFPQGYVPRAISDKMLNEGETDGL